jgi:Leucine-rich repeat (LRR) protein
MDKDDRQQDLVALLNGPMNELKDFFKPEFAKGLTVGGEKLVIDSFSHGAIGKFIALYGLDDLIGNLPDTLKEFQIQNRDQKDLTITIPEEIGRFKDLNMILLDNCIDSIPDSICTLPKLRFLALINNPKLTTIPDCIADLPNLYFLNLKGSPNVEVPQSIKDKGTDFGNGMWDLEGGE